MVYVKHKRVKKNRIVTEILKFLKPQFIHLDLDLTYKDSKKDKFKTIKLFVDGDFFVSWRWTYALEESLLLHGVLVEPEIINLISDSFYQDLLMDYPPTP